MSSFWAHDTFPYRAQPLQKKFYLSTCAVLSLFLLAACGQQMPSGYPGSPKSTVTPGTLNPLTVPPVIGEKPGEGGASNGLPPLQARGLNTQLFSDKLSDRDQRLTRLETAVQAIRDDFDVMAPSITRLVAIEQDIQNLIAQLEVLTGVAPAQSREFPPIEQSDLEANGTLSERREANAEAIMGIALPVPGEAAPPDDSSVNTTPALAPMAVAPESGSVMEDVAPDTTPKTLVAENTQANPAIENPASTAPLIAATELKTGEHPGKTRIVIYLNGNGTFTTDLDNNENLLLVEIPGVRWEAPVEEVFKNSPLLSFYSVTSHTPDKTILTFQLKQPAKIAYSGKLAQETGGGQRLIIDLTPQK